jgi:RNA polymerase sigma-70 factor, ECF subfamily
MHPNERQSATRTLVRARSGDASAAVDLMPIVYDELRALAARYLRNERAGHILQPTALVHEAFLRLFDDRYVQRLDRVHFLALAAVAMRRILVEHARARAAGKRGGDAPHVTLDSGIVDLARPGIDLLTLEDALGRLAGLDERQARVVELRFFGGLSIEEVAEALGVSPRSVDADWALARAWLHRELGPD